MSEPRQLPPNVYETTDGYRAVAKVGIHRKDRRFPRDTAIGKIRDWQDTTRKQLRTRHRAQKRSADTLAADVVTFLATLPKSRAKAETATCLAAWVAALGDRRRSTLTVLDLRTVVAKWIEDGRAANTINHRRRALVQLTDALDGDDVPNLARQLKRQREPEPQARAVSMELLDAIISGMDEHRSQRHPGRGGKGFRNKSRARLLMLLWIGLSPTSLMRLKPHAIDLEREEITLPPRQKGRGAPPVTLPLFPRGVDACRAWLRAFAWGIFNLRSLRHAFDAAVARYAAKESESGRPLSLPADLRVYDLRHSFLSWLWKQTRDPLLVQHFGQHRDLKTTSRYTRGAVDPRARHAVEELKKRLAGAIVSETGKTA